MQETRQAKTISEAKPMVKRRRITSAGTWNGMISENDPKFSETKTTSNSRNEWRRFEERTNK